MFDTGFAGGGGLDVEDLAGLIDVDAGGSEATGGLLSSSVFAGCLGLLVGLGEGAAEDPGSGDNDLSNNAVSLEGRS